MFALHAPDIECRRADIRAVDAVETRVERLVSPCARCRPRPVRTRVRRNSYVKMEVRFKNMDRARAVRARSCAAQPGTPACVRAYLLDIRALAGLPPGSHDVSEGECARRLCGSAVRAA